MIINIGDIFLKNSNGYTFTIIDITGDKKFYKINSALYGEQFISKDDIILAMFLGNIKKQSSKFKKKWVDFPNKV